MSSVLGSFPLELPDEKPSEFLFSETFYSWVATVDHKRLGLMYIATGLLFFVIAGTMASVIRLQLAFPNQHVVPSPRLSTGSSRCMAPRWFFWSVCRFWPGWQITWCR